VPALRLAASIALPPSVFRKASVLARNALISPIVVSLSALSAVRHPRAAPCPAAPVVARLIFVEWTAFSSRPRAWARVLLGDALVLRLSGSALFPPATNPLGCARPPAQMLAPLAFAAATPSWLAVPSLATADPG